MPLAAFVFLGHADSAAWIPRTTFRRVDYLVYALLSAGSSAGEHKFEFVPYAVVLFAAGASALAAWRTQRLERETWHHALVIGGAALPIILVLMISLFKPIFVDKYLIECLPFTVLLVAVGIDRLRPRTLSLAALVVTIVISVHALVGYYRRSDKDDWRAATRYVLGSARPGDAALFFPSFVVAPFDYYRAGFDATAESVEVIYPGALGDGDVGDVLARLPDRYRRLWAVFNQDGEAGGALRDSLSGRYRIESDRQFTGVRVDLYDAR